MLVQAKELFQVRELIVAWTSRTVRGRYQQSALGWLWALIQPAATVILFSVIFTQIVPIDTGDIPYPVFSYVAVVPWTLLAASLGDMTASLVGNMDLVSKIYFPREILPISAMLARLIDFFIAFALLLILMVLYQIPVYPPAFLFLPLILLIQLALIVGLGLILAAANVFYRDVQSLVTLGIQLWFYASPIIYPVSLVPESLHPIYFLNPMAGILEAYRAVLLYQTVPSYTLVIAAVQSVIFLFVGYWFFKRIEFQIPDIV